MPELNITEWGKYLKQMRTQRDQFWDLLQDAFEYCRPDENEFNKPSAGDEKNIYVYDDTAPESVDTFEYRYSQALIPVEKQWTQFRIPAKLKQQLKQMLGPGAARVQIQLLEARLQEQTDIFHEYVRTSNLETEYRSSFRDLSISTFIAAINETGDPRRPFSVRSIPLHQSYIMDRATGMGADVGRDVEIQVQDIAIEFPGVRLTERLRNILKQDSTKKVKITESVIQDRDTQVYYYYVTHQDDAHLMVRKLYSDPYIVGRTTKNSHESYGRGPGIRKLPTIKSLNKMREYRLTGMSRAAGGLFMAVDDGVLNPFLVDLSSDTVIPVDNTDSIKELPYTGRPEVLEFEITTMKEEIRSAFLADPPRALDDPNETATLSLIKEQRDLEKKRGGYSRGRREILEPTVTRIVDILVRMGIMDEIVTNRQVVEYKYTSPMALQLEMEELQNLTQAVQISRETVGEAKTMQTYNYDRIARAPAEKLGIDHEYLNTPEEAEAAAEQIAQMQEQAQGGQSV